MWFTKLFKLVSTDKYTFSITRARLCEKAFCLSCVKDRDVSYWTWLKMLENKDYSRRTRRLFWEIRSKTGLNKHLMLLKIRLIRYLNLIVIVFLSGLNIANNYIVVLNIVIRFWIARVVMMTSSPQWNVWKGAKPLKSPWLWFHYKWGHQTITISRS